MSTMASELEKTKNALSDLECLRAISVQNLPSDVTKELLQCLFPEASEIKLTADSDGKYKRRSSIIIFPKVSNALYYADQDRTIKLDNNSLSIQSLVHDDTSSSGRKKQADLPNSDNREKDRCHQDKNQSYGTPGDNNRSSNQHMSSHGRHRSLSPSYRNKREHDPSSRSSLRQDDHSSRSLSHREDYDRRVMLHQDDHIGRPPSCRDDHISRPPLHRNIKPSSHWDDHESRSSRQDKHSHSQYSRHEEFSRSSDGNNCKILLKNLPQSVSRPNIFSVIPNAKEITIHNNKSGGDSIISVVEFYTGKEAEAFLRKKRDILLHGHILTMEPYTTDRADPERNIHLRTRSQSPPALRQHKSSPSHRISQRSRSPLIRHHSPSIQRRSSSERGHLPRSNRSPLFHMPLETPQSSFVQLKSSTVLQNDRFHYIAPFAMQQQNIGRDQLQQPNEDERDGGGGMHDERFVSITSQVNEQFGSQQSGRYVEIAPHGEHSTTKVKDIFSQFKNHAKKFATENPNSARALNELLVALGNTNQPSLKCSPLDDLQKAFNPEDRLHCDLWHKSNPDYRSSDPQRSRDGRNFERKDLLDLPKLSSVLEQVKDLTQNLDILSQLSQLARHLKTDSSDSNAAASMALSSLEKLVSKTADALSDNSRKLSQNRDMDDHFSTFPNDYYYKTEEMADFQDDSKYMSIDYKHQKPTDEMDRPSLYQKENYHYSRYDDTHDYKDQHQPDYDLDSQPGHRTKSNHGQYDERPQPYDEPYDEPFNDDWYENSNRRNPRELGLMDHDYRIQSDGYDLDKFQHGMQNSRYDDMPDRSYTSGGFDQYWHHSNDLHQDMSQMDGENYPDNLPQDDDDENKPLGWRYYSMGMKTFKYK